MNDLTREFDSITANDVPLVGGKGANLGEMTRAGLPVPPGFVLTADAYRAFLAAADGSAAIMRRLAEMRMDDTEDVEQKSAALREELMTQPMPERVARAALAAYRTLGARLGQDAPRVAVRSSATAEDLPDASFAGQQDTYLNVRGETALLEHIKRCWASLWTARAIGYRHKQGYAQDKVALAVVTQAMLESEVAGILFTANPVNQRRDQAVLNASWGLGEAVVSGLVTPDTWLVRKTDGAILESEIAPKEVAVEYAPQGGTRAVSVPLDRVHRPSLNEAQVRALTAIGVQVEAHYARPLDIEWGWARGQFYLLQARPITTLAEDAGRRTTKDEGRWTDKGRTNEGGVSGEYNRTMFLEIFPDPLSPAFLSVIAPLFGSMLDFTFQTLGFTPPDDIPPVGVFYNQPYFHREYIEGALAPLTPQVRAAMVAQIVNPFGRQARKLPTEASPVFARMVTRLLRFMQSFPKQLPGLLAEYRAEIAKLDALPLREMSERAILLEVRETLFEHANRLLNYDFLMIALIGITYQLLGTLLERYYGQETETVRARLISGVTGNVTMETNKKLWDLAQEARSSAAVRAALAFALAQNGGTGAGANAMGNERAGNVRAELEEILAATGDGRIFRAELDAFLERYGHRELRMDILYPTWGEDPSPVLQFLRGYLEVDPQSSPQSQQARLVREREQLARDVAQHLQRDPWGRLALKPLFQWVLENTQQHTRERDTMHFELTRLFPPLRRALLELGTRWRAEEVLEQEDDIFFLTLEEMEQLAQERRPMQAVIQARRAEFQENTRQPAPPFVREGVAAYEGSRGGQETASETGTLRGIAGSPGVVSGLVRVVRGPHEFDKLQRGEILVAPLTNPVWTPLFAIAGGLVTQVGGILSHGAIVAREYGIPAVMAAPNATSLLRDGQRVTVDGDRGIVRIG